MEPKILNTLNKMSLLNPLLSNFKSFSEFYIVFNILIYIVFNWDVV
jgi:hypothetical protein